MGHIYFPDQTPHQKKFHQILSQSKHRTTSSLKDKYREKIRDILSDLNVASETISEEYRFAEGRRWAFDFAIPSIWIAIEIQGGGFGRTVVCNHCGQKVQKRLKSGRLFSVREGGRHANPASLDNEYEKLNNAQLRGWRVLLFSTKQIDQGYAESVLKEVLFLPK